MSADGIDILMYHSVSDGEGPTCIAPQTFRRQMEAIAEQGGRGVALAELSGWLRGEGRPDGKPVVLTFDDGFTDFADVVYPELRARGWTATVFLPAGKAGGFSDWDAAPALARRPLLSWAAAAELAALGVEIGAHGVSHADLTALPPEAARAEVADSRRRIEDRIGRPVTSFAAPYGRTNEAVRAEVRRHYRAAVGTELGRARPTSDPHELPRLEMWYFRDPARWQAYLAGARGYFLLRQVLRRAKRLVG